MEKEVAEGVPTGISQEAVERLLGRKELALLILSEENQKLREQLRAMTGEKVVGIKPGV